MFGNIAEPITLGLCTFPLAGSSDPYGRITGEARSPSGVKSSAIFALASTWRPNRCAGTLLFPAAGARKRLIFFAWGARGPGFKSRRPDHLESAALALGSTPLMGADPASN